MSAQHLKPAQVGQEVGQQVGQEVGQEVVAEAWQQWKQQQQATRRVEGSLSQLSYELLPLLRHG